MVHLNDQTPINPLLIKYVNRLSDLLYTFARYTEECQDFVNPNGDEWGKACKTK